MKSILISPAGEVQQSGTPNYGDQPADFDMLSFLVNEFDNQDIRALVLELDDASAQADFIRLTKRYNALRKAARVVVARWSGGDLAAAVRDLAVLVEHGA